MSIEQLEGQIATTPPDRATTVGPQEAVQRRQRPAARIAMHWIRRTHLYLGLFLFPWAVLYGATGFLFNHPAAFNEQEIRSFSQQDWKGTDFEQALNASQVAEEVVRALESRGKVGTKYKLVNPHSAMFVREMAAATVKSEGRQTTVFVDVLGRGGLIRTISTAPQSAAEKPPFAIGKAPPERQRSMGMGGSMGGTSPASEKLVVANPVAERIRTAIPPMLDRLGLPKGEVVLGSFPDLLFNIEAEGRVWAASYNAVSGSVTGRPIETAGEPLNIRRFLTRLHLAHGYPYSMGARWLWAVIVDGMAFVMLFWGLSGLLMWWQIKMTRRWGWVTLIASFASAGGLAWGMFQVLLLG